MPRPGLAGFRILIIGDRITPVIPASSSNQAVYLLFEELRGGTDQKTKFCCLRQNELKGRVPTSPCSSMDKTTPS